MTEKINDGLSESGKGKTSPQDIEARAQQLAERFRPEVMTDEVRDIFRKIGIKQFPSPGNPNHVKFDLPSYLIANVNGGIVLDQRGSVDWKTWTFDSNSISVVLKNGLIVEKDKSGQETTFDIKLADNRLRRAGFYPNIDGSLGIPQDYLVKSLNNGKEYKGELMGSSPIKEINVQSSRSDPSSLVLNIIFSNGSQESFGAIKEIKEVYISQRILVANSLRPNVTQPIDMQVNNDGSKILMNINGNEFTLKKIADGEYQDHLGHKWISRKMPIGTIFIQQN